MKSLETVNNNNLGTLNTWLFIISLVHRVTRLMKTGNWHDIDFQISRFVHNLYRFSEQCFSFKLALSSYCCFHLSCLSSHAWTVSLLQIFQFHISFRAARHSPCWTQSRLRFICFINAFRAFETIQNQEDSFKTPNMTKLVTLNLGNLSFDCNLAYMITAILILSKHDCLLHRSFFL